MEKPLTTQDLLPDLPNYDPEPADGVRVGESPVPGITLKRILRGHTGAIGRIAWSPDGRFIAAPHQLRSINIWDVAQAQCITKLKGHTKRVYSIAWLNDEILFSSSQDETINVWDTNSGNLLHTLEGHNSEVRTISISPDGQYLASGAADGSVLLWELRSPYINEYLITNLKSVRSVSWSPNGQLLAVGCGDKSVRVLNPKTGQLLSKFTGHYAFVFGVAWLPDNNRLVSGSGDQIIKIWNIDKGIATHSIESHNNRVNNITISFDGNLMASKSGGKDSTVRIWNCSNWQEIGVINELGENSVFPGIAFHPYYPCLATLGENDKVIRIWELDINTLLKPKIDNYIGYTTAKLALVGDSGVGKTGLGWRLAHNEFKVHDSTHGQQFWPIPDLGQTRSDGTQCEAVLWDLAGQPIYRPIHAIFLDNVDASLILFDPTNRQDPLKGVESWLQQLKGKDQLPPSVLVGARSDTGTAVLSQQELDQFCQQHGISGGYISTSAKDGSGLEQLIDILKSQIPWDEMTTTVTTRTFKRIKDFVLSLKEQPDRQNVLIKPAELRTQLESLDENWAFTDPEMMTAIGHLETHGYITVLTSSSGSQYILLFPELLANTAASIHLLGDKNPRELGAVIESVLLQVKHPFDELHGLAESEKEILLDAAVLRFLQHNICFREQLDDNILLIFPTLIKQKRPLQDDIPTTDDISYIVRGRVENIYASLVVLLGYTPTFSRRNQWQNQAQYQTEIGYICGFRLIEEREGEIELILYYGDDMPLDDRFEFQGLFERFLYQRDVSVTPFPPIICPNGHLQERAVVVKRQQNNKTFLFCDECGEKTNLPDITQAQTIGLSAAPWLQREEASARLRSAYEANLSRIKGFRRNWAAPRCYLSYLPEEEKTANRLRHDLSDAGAYLLSDPTQMEPSDTIIILNTPAYRTAFNNPTGPLKKEDIILIQSRLNLPKEKQNLTALVVDGRPPHQHDLETCQRGNFCDPTHYPISLFDLVLDLYQIPIYSPGFAPLRQALHQQWEQTLAEETKSNFKTTPSEVIHQEETNMSNLSQLTNEKLRRLLASYFTETSTTVKFQLEHQIQEVYDDVKKFDVELDADNQKSMNAFLK